MEVKYVATSELGANYPRLPLPMYGSPSLSDHNLHRSPVVLNAQDSHECQVADVNVKVVTVTVRVRVFSDRVASGWATSVQDASCPRCTPPKCDNPPWRWYSPHTPPTESDGLPTIMCVFFYCVVKQQR